MSAAPAATARVAPAPQTAEVFSATCVAVVTFFFGFPAGIVLAAITLRRLGYDDEARDYLVRGAFGTIAFVAALLILPGGVGNLLALAVNVALLIHLRRMIEETITAFSAEGNTAWYTNGLFGAGLGIAVLACVALFAVVGSMLLALIP